MKKAFITGVTGQDGSYLANFLLNKGYKVFGGIRRTSSSNYWRLDYLKIFSNKNFKLVEVDLTDPVNVFSAIESIKPDEIYNLAAQSFVSISFDQPTTTSMINSIGALNILEAIKKINKKIKFYQASTSEMFGKVQEIPQTENTPFYPRSPYGVSKLYAHWITINYRESYDIFATSGILFNHESPLRGLEFVTRKITDSLAKIALGKQKILEIGNLDAKRDWGFAGDYVEGMWLMLQHDKPDNYILSTNETHSVREFIEIICRLANFNLEWVGKGIDEFGINKKTGKKIIKINKNFFRPAEVDILIGSNEKAKKVLKWSPKIAFNELAAMMFEEDYKRNK